MRIILVLGMIAFSVHAQSVQRGTVAGRVLDPSGAAIPGAAVAVKSGSTGEPVQVIADSQGRFAIRLLPGDYSVSVEAPGFERFSQERVAVTAGASAVVTARLAISAMAEQVTVTAKAADMVEALEHRQVKESGARDAGEALASVEGVWKIRKGGIANDVLIRGFQQGNINVLIDGARIYGACPNHMDPAAYHVDFSEIQQVEISKGPFDVRNQGNLGGSVNIISRTPLGGLQVTPNFSAGSFGYINPAMTASLSNEKVWALAGASYRRSGPYRDGAGRRFTEYANYKSDAQDLSAFDVRTGWFRFGATPSDNQRTEVTYTRQQSGRVLYPYLMMDAGYDNADRLAASYLIAGRHGILTQLRVQSYFTRVKHWMTDELRLSAATTPRPYSMATFAGTKALGARVEAELSGVTVGFEGYRRNWNAVNTMRMAGMYMDQPAIPDVNMTVAGLYAMYRRTLGPKAELSGGARLDGATSEARSAGLNTDLYFVYQGTRAASEADVNPSASLRLTYALPAGFQAFAGVGHAARLPDPTERYFALKRGGSDWVGNPSLRATRNTEGDLGISYRNRWLNVRSTAFYSRLADFITLHDQVRINMLPGIMNAAARSYENVDARMYGGELAYNIRLSRTLIASGGLSYVRGIKQARPADLIFSRNLSETPPLKSTASLRYGTRIFFAEIQGLAAAAQDHVDTDLREQRTPGYAVMNMRAGVHTAKLNLAAGLDNVLNRFYYEHGSYQRDPFRFGVKVPEPGRSVFVSASYAF